MDTPGPEPLTETALDREIRAALNVEPSPAFVARVRQRIADEPIMGAWRLSWSLVTATALAVVLVGVFVVRVERSTRQHPALQQPASIGSRTFAGMSALQADRRSGRVPQHSEDGAAEHPPSVRLSTGPSVGSGFSRILSANSPTLSGIRTTPEILIDAREAEALRALFAGAGLGNVDLVPLASAAAKAASELTPPEEIVVAPLVNEPLTPVPGEGARP